MTKTEWMQMYELVGAAQEVYNQLGRGMAEPIYQSAMEEELKIRSIDFKREVPLKLWYKGVLLKKIYIADFVSNDIIIEFKSVDKICSEHRAQLFNYLRITKQKYGLLVNYGEDHFHSERYVYDEHTDRFELITKDNLSKYVH